MEGTGDRRAMLRVCRTTAPRDAAGEWIGRVLEERYRIEAQLGAGGLGMVFRAVHVGLDRPVAVKVLHPELLPSDSLRQRFDREVKTLSRLMHPHIVTLTDSGILQDGTGYLVMELLEGESLEQRMRAGALLRPTPSRSSGRSCSRSRRRTERASSTATSSRPTCSSLRWPTAART
ncbi:MAG: protein kinase [Sandaracinaceae bacterium]|nr:protein kinase [Sandaracinaceae bacterium]